ncbi:hypothetical protein IFM89_007094 [Coptis chinensis]|uniref:Uncharacterized protein n=1 Tax=Coptis chinensis TaxID=261450 RepID=A0A835H2F7_9MAGN|nr:hypothetical protein IFM89_007094 [Coptis chinensis]
MARVQLVFSTVPGLVQAFLDVCLEEVSNKGYQAGGEFNYALGGCDWTEEVWENVIERNPDVQVYKNKPLPNANELYKLFEVTLV